MSILKSTHSGTYKELTIQDILDRGWRFETKVVKGMMGLPFGGKVVDDRTKMYFINSNNRLNVIQEGSQLFLQGVWEYDFTSDGKEYTITKILQPRTLHDFEVLEAHYKIEKAEDKVANFDKLFNAGFTITQVQLKPTMGVSGYDDFIRTMTPYTSIIPIVKD